MASSLTTARPASTRRTASMARGRVADAVQPHGLIAPTSMPMRRPQALSRANASALASCGNVLPAQSGQSEGESARSCCS